MSDSRTVERRECRKPNCDELVDVPIGVVEWYCSVECRDTVESWECTGCAQRIRPRVVWDGGDVYWHCPHCGVIESRLDTTPAEQPGYLQPGIGHGPPNKSHHEVR